MTGSRKAYVIKAQWDGEAGVSWCSNDEVPLTTEAPTFEQLIQRVLEIPAENGLAMPAGEIELYVVAERIEAVRLSPQVNAGDLRSRAAPAPRQAGGTFCRRG
jgi:hypothetical protein